MSRQYAKPDPAATARLFAAAVAAGTHAAGTWHVCGGCGRVVDAIHNVTLAKVPLCGPCTRCAGCYAEMPACPACGSGDVAEPGGVVARNVRHACNACKHKWDA